MSFVIRTRSACYLALLGFAGLAACRGGATSGFTPAADPAGSERANVFASQIVSEGAAPPKSIASITPAPGYPSAPPLNLRLTPPKRLPVSTASARIVTLSGTVGAGQIGGSSLKGSVTGALLSALPTPDPNTLVFGIVEGYTSDGIRLRTQPLVEPSPGGSPVAGVAPIPGPKIPATLVVRVSGKTVDAVPGGFRSIRTGDRITAVVELAGSSQPIAKYLSDFTVLGKNVRPDRMVAPHSFASFSREAVAQSAFAEAMTRLQPNAAAPVKFSFKGQTSPYAKGLLTPVEPAFPYPIQMPFGSITIQWESSLSFGESVNYPLQLVDESASYSWNENLQSVLPVAVLNDTATSPTYTIDGASVVAISAKIAYSYKEDGREVSGSGEYLLAQSDSGDSGDPGLTFQSTSMSKLLAPDATATIAPSRKAIYTVNLASAIEDLVGKLDPSAGNVLAGYPEGIPLTVEQYIQGTLSGGWLATIVDVTNANPTTSGGPEYFSVDNVPLGVNPGVGFPWMPTGSQSAPAANVVTLSEAPKTYLYAGKATHQYLAETKSPLGNMGPLTLQNFTGLPDEETGFHEGKFSPARPAITLSPSAGNVSECIADNTQGDHDGGGTCSSKTVSAVMLDIVGAGTATVQVTDIGAGGRTISPDAFTVNLNNPPPQSLSGVPPYTCPSAGITVAPTSGTTDPFSITVTMPPGNQVPDGGCGFAIVDSFGTTVYASLTDDVPSSARRGHR